MNTVRSGTAAVPFVGEFDELGSDGTTLRWTAMAGAEVYLVEAFGAADLSGGVLGDILVLGTSLELALLSLSAGDYWIRVKAVKGVLDKVWRDGGLPVKLGTNLTDLVCWQGGYQWVYSPAKPFSWLPSGLYQNSGSDPAFGWIVITGGTGWPLGTYRIEGHANPWITQDGDQIMAKLPHAALTVESTRNGVAYWEPDLTQTKQVVLDGNSLFLGDNGESPDVRLRTSLTRKWKLGGNFAVGGKSTLDMAADAAAQVDVIYDAAGLILNVLVAWEGTNQMYYGASGSTAIADYKAYCAARKAAGWYTVAVTVLPREAINTVFAARRAIFNAEILNPANIGVCWDAVVDTTADSRLEDPSDTTYFNADQIHPKAAGSRIVGELIGALLKPL